MNIYVGKGNNEKRNNRGNRAYHEKVANVATEY